MINYIRLCEVVKKHRGSNCILNFGDFKFDNSKINVVLGANGSGKTTLLNLVAGIETPDGGSVILGNREVPIDSDLSRVLKNNIGYVMQNPYLFNMTVFENIALGLRFRKLKKYDVESRVYSMIRMLNIDSLAFRNVRSLSGGEYQKVAIGQVLVLNPEIILLDEPTANIDEENITGIENILNSIYNETGAVVIITTHSLKQAFRLSERVTRIQNGKLITDMRVPDELYLRCIGGVSND
jgi:tungstate transport system ATP-binding protein